MTSEKVMQDIIKQAYYIFQNYRPHKPLGVCCDGCCITPENLEHIYHTKLTQLPVSALYDYLTAAEITSEELIADNSKYFVPRILELLWQSDFSSTNHQLHHSTALILKKFYLRTDRWKKDEIELLEQYSEKFFELKLLGDDSENPFNYLLMFAIAGLNNTQNLLSIWIENLQQSQVLKKYLSCYADYLYPHGKFNYQDSFAKEYVPEFIEVINQGFINKNIATKLIPLVLDFITQDTTQSYQEDYQISLLFDELYERQHT